MIFALCTTLRDATTAQLKDPAYCKKYVGALWIPAFIEKMEKLGHEVVTGHEALSMPAGMVRIIQEDMSPEGMELISRGAKGSVLFCLESPLYAPLFYDQTEKLASNFQHVWSYHYGDPIPFPSFEAPDPSPLHWNLRRPICMVASNKHYSQMGVHGDSPSYAKALQHQLHDERYAAIGSLKGLELLDLYGKGWPPEVGFEVADKHSTIQKYKFAVCFENVAMPGYVTEKIIDCFAAGVIPIYLGAPDIQCRIPSSLYIDYRKFKSWAEVLTHLTLLDTDEAGEMIDDAEEWLNSIQGQRYTYNGFAEGMVERCLT